MRLLRIFFAAAILNYESTVIKKVAPNEKKVAPKTKKFR